jgi:hypothetical protein
VALLLLGESTEEVGIGTSMAEAGVMAAAVGQAVVVVQHARAGHQEAQAVQEVQVRAKVQAKAKATAGHLGLAELEGRWAEERVEQ